MSLVSYPLHPAQKDVLIDQLLNPDSPYYNIGCYTKLIGSLDIEKFKEAVRSLPEAFDVFRMHFDIRADIPCCYFTTELPEIGITEIDFSNALNPKEDCFKWMQDQFNIPFDLESGEPLFQKALLKIGDSEYWYFYKNHHLITDGYGIALEIQHVAKKYKSLLNGVQSSFNYPLYKTMMEEAVTFYQSPAYELEGVYWRNKLKDLPEKLLHRRYPNDGTVMKKSGTYVVDISSVDQTSLESVQMATGASMQQLLIAALSVYYATISGQSNLTFGIPLHKRRSRKMKDTVGMFSGMLPFRKSFDRCNKIRELIKSIGAAQKEDYRYQQYQMGDLSRDLKLNSVDDYLIEIVVNYGLLNFDLDFGGNICATTLDLSNEYGRFPIEFLWRDYGKQQPSQLRIDYQYEYFQPEEIVLLSERIVYILRQLEERLDQNAEQIQIIPPAEVEQLARFNDTTVKNTGADTFLKLFSARSHRHGSFPALLFGELSLTYAEIDEQSDQLSAFLINSGVQKGDLIPLCFERVPAMAISILAVWKAGAAYVPIDQNFPEERVRYIIDDTNASIVLGDSNYLNSVSWPDRIKLIAVDKDWKTIAEAVCDFDMPEIFPQDLSYVIYTSGSTGRPKGVLIEHAGMLNHLLAKVNDLQLSEKDIIAQTASFSFDISIWQLFVAFCVGGKTVIYSDKLIADPPGLLRRIREDQITILEWVPSYLTSVLEGNVGNALSGLRFLLVTGEAVLPAVLQRWFNDTNLSRIPIVNAYGPTEASDDITHYFMYGPPAFSVTPIGAPIQNLKIYIVSKTLDLFPIGIAGEICVSGIGVGRGYLNLPELTAERFIDNPFVEGARLYRTGDLGRWLADGNIEYLGRMDDQVKIRGYRIELGEIESVLQQYAGVRQAVVVARTEGVSKRLVGYVVSEGSLDKRALINYLKERLPEYMVPGVLMELASLPLTANGKVDKRSLPAPEQTQTEELYAGARNETERVLCGIWSELLGVEQVGIDDNFFELGGDSIITIQVVSRARRSGYILQPRDLFVHQTVRGLSSLLGAGGGQGIEGEQGVLEGESGLLPIQSWYFEQADGVSDHFNQSILISIDKGIDAAQLERSLAELVLHHDALRFRYSEDEQGRWHQYYDNSKKELFHVYDISEGEEYRSALQSY